MKFFFILYSFLSLTLSSQIIKLCKNCKHFIPQSFKNDFIVNQNLGKCDKFFTLINDELHYENTNKARENESMCGSKGKYHYPNSKKLDNQNYKIVDY